MPLTLRSDVRLEPRVAEGFVALFPDGESRSHRPIFRLHPWQGMALSLFDGHRAQEDVAGILSSVLGRSIEDARHLVTTLLRRYRQFLIEGKSSSVPFRSKTLDSDDFLFATHFSFKSKREAAPSALRWVVTEYCDKKCQYCFMNAIFTEGAAPDLDLGYDRVCEIIEEASEIGVNRLILSGGEPFLRPDLIDLIGLMVEKRIDVVPITKSRIVGARMKALATTGLSELHISLDSHRAAAVDQLTGIAGAFEQMTDTIKGAVAHGINVVLRPVLTNLNVRDIEGIILLALDLGVARIRLDVYGQTCGRHQQSLKLTPDSNAWLEENWPRLEARYRDRPVDVAFDLPTGPGEVEKGCVEGLRGMTLLPDGRVTKCDRWQRDDQLIYGDLRHQSIVECWNSEELMGINFPERESYTGTICYHCKNLPTCDHVRGRCSMSSLAEYNTPSAPDTYCPIGAFKRHLPGEASCGQGCGSSRDLVQLGDGRSLKTVATP